MKHSVYFEEARAAKKWFLMDKNYILKESQIVLKEQLVFWTVNYAKKFYQQHHNPLGLLDDTVAQIEQAKFTEYHLLETFYSKLASVYRYKHGETQLEMLFDGATHYEKYKADWLSTYKKWVDELFMEWLTLRAILEITVFKKSDEHQLHLFDLRLQTYIEDYFEVRLYVYKGIIDRHEAA
jgi:hypothetical protein